jgi:hypothetical protein
MPQIIEIPGVGEVEFPDEMGDEEIVAAVQKLSGPQPVAAHEPGAEVYRPPRVGQVESALRGGLQGLSSGWGEELTANAAAGREGTPSLLRGVVQPGAPFADVLQQGAGLLARLGRGGRETYGRTREAERTANRAAEEANPRTYLASQVAGAVAPSLVGGAPATGGRALLQAAGLGAAQGAGYSDADEIRGLASDTALGTALGLAGYGAGQVLGKGAAATLRKGRDLVRTGTARAGTQATGEVAEELATAAGRVGGEVQKGSRQVENLMRLEQSMTPEQRALYRQLQASGVVPDLQQAVAQSTLEGLPSQAATIAARKAELATLQSAAPQRATERTAELLTPQPRADIKSFLKSYAEPAAWALAGERVADWSGADPRTRATAGVIAGALGARTRAGKALWTRLNRPAHQAAIGRKLERIGGSASTPLGKMLLQALERGAPAALIPGTIAEEP